MCSTDLAQAKNVRAGNGMIPAHLVTVEKWKIKRNTHLAQQKAGPGRSRDHYIMTGANYRVRNVELTIKIHKIREL